MSNDLPSVGTDLTKLAQLAKQHSSSYASPHHFVLSVAGLRSIIEAALRDAPQAEPVAWVLYFTNEHGTPMREPFFSKAHMERHKLHNETMRGLECRVELLYSTPSAPTAVEP